MAQLLELKNTKPAVALPLANAVHNDALPIPAPEEQKEDSPWEAAKRGAKLEVSAFDGSLDPKKYMDWESGLDEYFDWYQLPKASHSVRTDEAHRASPDLLAESTGYHGAPTRANDYIVGRNEEPATGQVRPRLLPPDDHR